VLSEAVFLTAIGFGIVAVMMLILWVIHLVIKNAAIVDVGWAAGLGLLAIYYASAAHGWTTRKWLVGAMAAIWSARLAIYLLFTRVLGKAEEGRYVQLRQDWKSNLPLRFLFFFEFQALLDVALSLPFLLACLNTRYPLGWAEPLGVAIAMVAIIGEALADQQLNNFKTNPANQGKTCQAGLWKYSRHPNYFFEWLIWVGFATFAITSPWGFVGILSPVLMLCFLLGLTGIPATEAQALRSRGEEYRDYQRRTSAFVPWFAKQPAKSLTTTEADK
jgi:steroid 5-alpha reductase family enzyme